MGWSYRKSFGSGPFRVNFSKSGISYSVGMKGARVNVGPRGTYVSLSSHGISYRRKIGDVPHHSAPVPPQTFNPVLYQEPHNIASADVGQLTDTDSKDFVAELTKKSGQIAYAGWLGVFPLVIFTVVMLFTSFSTRTIINRPSSDSIVATITSPIGVYIRNAPTSKSGILRTATAGEHFALVDSTNKKWLKISMHDTVGYVGSRFAAINRIHHERETSSTAFLSNPYAGYEFGLGLTVFTFWIIRLKRIDKRRFEILLHYEMDENFGEIYKQFGEHFSTFTRSVKIWQYLNTEKTIDVKRNAGAGNLIRRTPIAYISPDKAPAEYFITNIAIPYIRLANIELYFLPERVLVKQRGKFAAVFYKNLHITKATTRFIEEETLAQDAQVVDTTWRYVNKSGGPDRRFNGNRQLPICSYSEYTLKSDTGIYEVITSSKLGAMDAFADFLTAIGSLQSKMAGHANFN